MTALKKIETLLLFLFIGFITCHAQQYTGMSGLIHVPSGEMDNEGSIRIGGHYLDKHFLPNKAFDLDEYFPTLKQGKYNSFDFYASITPFSWMEIGYTITLRKSNHSNTAGDHDISYCRKDQYFSFKVQPVKEGKWWPSIALGTNDPITTGGKKDTDKEVNLNQHFANYYIAATKHFMIKSQEIGITAVYRKFKRKYNSRWNGLVGGVTYRPSFARNFRGIVEWTGSDINVGIDCVLWNHLMAQISLQNGKYPSAGICYTTKLF